ncbi:CHAT domain-containing protein [candidate division KSB1 bacterium]|nr:CHAT domain-containing protein [candidate division KSB1 bacterium]
MYQKSPNPFIVGDWIKRDEDFIGRTDLIQKYLALERQYYWLIGARRMGKTSLLRYLQRQFQRQPDTLPLFWDVSGANSAYDLKLSLLDCLEAAGPDCGARGLKIPCDDLENDALLEILRWLIREANRTSTRLIFLIDESEVFFKVSQHDPQFMQRFKAIVLNHPALCLFLASNHGLAPFDSLNSDHLMAPLLQAFLPPDFLTPWSAGESRQLISKCLEHPIDQDQVIQHTGSLPFLVQLVCFYYHEFGNLTQTFDHIYQRNILDLFFRDDFHQLPQDNCEILSVIAEHEPIAIQSLTTLLQVPLAPIEQRLAALNWLGFVSLDCHKNCNINNQFLRDWIKHHYLPIYRKSIFHKETPPLSPVHQQMLIELSTPLVKISVLKNGAPVYENQKPVPLDASRDVHPEIQDLKIVRNLGQRLFQDIFGAFTEPALQEFFRPDDQRRDLILIEHEHPPGWIPFEYLHNGHHFLALKYGLFRTKNKNLPAPEQKPGFIQPLRILLFASNTPPDIPQVDTEIVILRDQLKKIARELQIELEITAILSTEADYLTWLNLLGSREYDIIHFAGHCRRDENSAADCIYFREQAGNRGRVQAMSLDDLAGRLSRNVMLFYLNTCQPCSSPSEIRKNHDFHFAEAILGAGVKSVIGNSTRIDDRLAAGFARDFYWQLFFCQFVLAKAMQQTRLKWSQQTRYQEGGHLSWLAPILWQN